MIPNIIAGNLAELKQQFYANPDDVEVILALANAYADLGRWEEAVEAYKIAIKLDPENGDLYKRLGVVFVALDDPDDAEDSYLRAIEHSPWDAESYNNLGELYRGQRRWSNAKYMFEKCLQLSNDPDERAIVRGKIISL
jgi:tetratricopeptide (TPR) repeat protein